MNVTLPNQRCAGPLLTDLYQLTMAYGYWKSGKADQEAVFELSFRTPPFQCGFTIAAGLAPAIDFIADCIYDLERGAPADFTLVDPLDSTRRKHLTAGTAFQDLLVPIFQRGKQVYQTPPLGEIRRRTQSQLARFHSGVKRFINPHQYPVGLESGLHELRTQLILQARGEMQP